MHPTVIHLLLKLYFLGTWTFEGVRADDLTPSELLLTN